MKAHKSSQQSAKTLKILVVGATGGSGRAVVCRLLAQGHLVRDSGVDWVLVQPVHLTNEESDAAPFVSTDGEIRNLKVARQSLAQFLATATHADQFVGHSVAVSG